MTLLDGLTGPDLCNRPHRMSKPMLYHYIRGNSTLMGRNTTSWPTLSAWSCTPRTHAGKTCRWMLQLLEVWHGEANKTNDVSQNKQRTNRRGSKIDAKRAPVNRLFVSLAEHEGRGAMSVGPLQRQLSVAVVTHNGACLFRSGHAWFHKN